MKQKSFKISRIENEKNFPELNFKYLGTKSSTLVSATNHLVNFLGGKFQCERSLNKKVSKFQQLEMKFFSQSLISSISMINLYEKNCFN